MDKLSLKRMNNVRRILVVAAVGLLPALYGCINLEPRENPTRFYVLGGPWEEDSPAQTTDGLSIGMRQLNLAAYLQTPRMVLRQGPNRIRFSEFHRWGEDLDRGINRAVAGYLAAMEPVQRVDIVPWSPRVPHDYTVQLRVLRFEGVAPDGQDSGAARLLITWEVRDPDDGDVVARGTTDFREEGWDVRDFDALASMLDRGLANVATEISEALAAL